VSAPWLRLYLDLLARVTAARLNHAGHAGYHPRVSVNGETPLVAREPLDDDYCLLTFRQPHIAQTARPGQFVMIKPGASAELPLRRPFSILGVAREQSTFSLFVKDVGANSHALSGLRQGDDATCLGPLGRPFGPPPAGAAPLLIAGGYGVAPLIFLARELLRDGHSPRLFYGGRRAKDLALAGMAEAVGMPVDFTTNDGSRGSVGLVTESLERHLDAQRQPTALFACGPHAMLRAVARIALARGLSAQLSLDPWMGCGVGICLSCVVRLRRAGEAHAKYRCACTEGPVFDARDIVWEEPASATAKGAR
jgi:dihydroorotate dehydrogenase electron transfer subunit